MTDPSLELQESGWEELRREARKIEGDLDVKLSSYAKLGARFTQGGYVDTASPTVGSNRSWKSMEMEIQSLLEKLLDTNDALSRCAASAAATSSTTQKLARHRDILHEYTQEFVHKEKMDNVTFRIERFDGKDFGFWKMQMEDVLYQKGLHEPLSGTKPDEMKQEEWDLKDRQALGMVRLTLSRNVVFNIEKVKTTAGLFMALTNMYEKPSAMNKEFRRIKGNINSMKEHAELLSSVRDDISEYKASGSMSPRVQLLRERAAIHGSIAHMDDVISQAQATKTVLGSQKAMFGDVQGKVKLLGDKFPVIRGLLASIRRRRSRDTLILSAVVAACTLFLIIYWLSK